jgi:hypothetical protein
MGKLGSLKRGARCACDALKAFLCASLREITRAPGDHPVFSCGGCFSRPCGEGAWDGVGRIKAARLAVVRPRATARCQPARRQAGPVAAAHSGGDGANGSTGGSPMKKPSA